MKPSVLALLLLVACASKPALDLGPAPEGVSVEAKIQYYDITASSLGEIRQGMRLAGPKWDGRTWSAVTTSDFRWTFKVARSATSCDIERAHVQVRTVMIFPHWTPTAEPDSALLEWWRQLNAGLVEHEKGHAQIALRTAGDIVKELDRVMFPCDDISRVANAKAQELVDKSRRVQSEYDTSTRHGATQIQQAGRLKEP